MWNVLRFSDPDKRGRLRVLCSCQCGFQKVHFLSAIERKRTNQCNNCRLKAMMIKVGTRFGKWSVVSIATDKIKAKYIIKCECDTVSRATSGDLRTGKTTQCLRCYNSNRINAPRTHSLSNTSTYRIWQRMKDRCFRKTDKDYKYYGGRGITVCDEWLIFQNFVNDMGIRPGNLQLDRINNNEGYRKDNCRWVTAKENSKNRRPKNGSRNSNSFKSLEAPFLSATNL